MNTQFRQKTNEGQNSQHKFNAFKDNRGYFNEKDKQRQRERRAQEVKLQKEFEKREKERIEQESLQMDNFPCLGVAASNTVNHVSSYIEKLKTEKEDNIEIDLEEKITPGWVLLKLDKLTRKTIMKYNTGTNRAVHQTEINPIYVLNKLVELHEKRTNEYIEDYGYDEWEKTFKSPNWIEDAAYYEQMSYDNYESESDEGDDDIGYDEDDYYDYDTI